MSKKFRIINLSAVFCLTLLLSVVLRPTPSYSEEIQIEIDVAPATLNIESNGVVVTVHTNIGYSAVDASAVFLNGILINSYKADSRGYFVAKFLMDVIKGLNLNIGDYNTLTLIGSTTDGDTFIGKQDIMVIDVLPQAK